jgi:hypothetical protein
VIVRRADRFEEYMKICQGEELRTEAHKLDFIPPTEEDVLRFVPPPKADETEEEFREGLNMHEEVELTQPIEASLIEARSAGDPDLGGDFAVTAEEGSEGFCSPDESEGPPPLVDSLSEDEADRPSQTSARRVRLTKKTHVEVPLIAPTQAPMLQAHAKVHAKSIGRNVMLRNEQRAATAGKEEAF